MYICIILNTIHVEYIHHSYFFVFDKLLPVCKMCCVWSLECKTQTLKIVQTHYDTLYDSPVLKETKFINFIPDLTSFCYFYALDIPFLVISVLVCKNHVAWPNLIYLISTLFQNVFLPWEINPAKFHAFNKMCTIYP